MRHVCCFVLCLFTLGPPPLHGQQLDIGRIPYKLGMTMQEASAMTHEPVFLDSGGNASATTTWAVREKHGENLIAIGGITFRNSRAETLWRFIKGFRSKDSVDVGNALFQALESLKHDDPSVSVQTRSVFMSSESGELKRITIGTGRWRVEISIPSAPQASMAISEVLTSASTIPTPSP
jgi:hypothetical protein